jgi:hypothetical protein
MKRFRHLKKSLKESQILDEISKGLMVRALASSVPKAAAAGSKSANPDLPKETREKAGKKMYKLSRFAGKLQSRLTSEESERVDLEEGENKQVKGGDPCWKGYEMVGMKKKGGKEVPNCVPVKEETSRKREIIKDIVKKKKAESSDKFEPQPTLTSQIVKEHK